MMSSPGIKHELRISPQNKFKGISPSPKDYDFLTQKIMRLEEDYGQVCSQLQKVRSRLRKAEDFQIKYDLLLKQKQSWQSEIVLKDSLIGECQSRIKQLEIEYSQKTSIELELKVQRDSLLREIQTWKLQFLESEELLSKIKSEAEYKMNQKLSVEIELVKKHYANLEEQYKSKIRFLEINLAEKNALQDVLKQKYEKNNQQKHSQIQRLQNNLIKLRQQHLNYAQLKNAEILSVANKFQLLFSNEIQKLKYLQETNSERFSLQVEGLRGLLQLKNGQINQLLKQSSDLRKSYLLEKTELLKQTSLLKEKIYQRQRESELQLYHLKQRLISLHQIDTKQMNENFEKINLHLEENIKQLQDLIRKKQKQINQISERFETRKNDFESVIESKNLTIVELQQKLRHTGDINAKQIDNLHSSFHKITTEKGQLSTEYQSTFHFLNTQITKLTNSNELKNQQIKDLHIQISQIKKNFSQNIKDLQKKWRIQRKQRQQQRTKQRDLRQKLEEQFREKQQKWRYRERTLERDKEKQEREKIKHKVVIEEFQKNVQRLTKHVKENEERLKQEMQRNQSNFVQTGSIRRQLNAELEKQRSEFESIKKMQIDQVHRQYEIQVARLTNQNQRLQNQLIELKINFEKLEEEYKKIANTTKNIDRINKEKLIDYERKMAALNAQINLTQNLYNSFINAKSKVSKKGQD